MALPEPGDILADRYRIDEDVGEGGFGRVYRALDIESARVVAVKMLKVIESDPTERSRFDREMKAIATFESPHIPKLRDHGRTEAGEPYMVTDFVDGEDLSQMLEDRGYLRENEAVQIAIGVLLALSEAHGHGLVHRDVKPANIRVGTHSNGLLSVNLLDFGIARSLDVDVTRLTASDAHIGTPRYMSPDRLFGEELTPKADLYSLGLVLFDVVLGMSARSAAPIALTLEIPASAPVSVALRSAIELLMSSDGFMSADEALDGFRSVVARPSMPLQRKGHAGPARDETPTAVRRGADPGGADVPPALIAAGILAFAAAIGAGYMLANRAPPESDRVRVPSRRAAPLLVGGVTTGPPPVRHDAESDVINSTDVAQDPPDVSRSVGCDAAEPLRRGDSISQAPGIALPVRLPSGYDHARPYPVIVEYMRRWDTPAPELAELADREGIVLVRVPHQGFERISRYTKLVGATAQAALELVCVDTLRVFVIARMSDVGPIINHPWVTAAAVTGSLIGGQPGADAARPVPLLRVVARDSTLFPFDGVLTCENAAGPRGKPLYGRVQTVSADRDLRRWRDHNGCRGRGTPTTLGARECTTWSCEAPLVTCETDGGGRWSHMKGRPGAKCVDDVSDFPYVEVIWAFFRSIR